MHQPTLKECSSFTNKIFERGKKSQKAGFDDIPAQISGTTPTIPLVNSIFSIT